MTTNSRRTVLANIAAALLVAGALVACITVIMARETARELAIPISLPFVAAAFVIAGIAWREPRAKFVATLALVVLLAYSGLAAYEWILPSAYTAADDSELPAQVQVLVPLHTPLGKPRPGDWLDRHAELGQPYGQYLRDKPVRPDARRRVLYVQPLGDFNVHERQILNLTAEFLGLYFQLPVRIRDELPLSVIPDQAWRKHSSSDAPQVHTDPILREVLKPRLPDDAVVMLALTTTDLYPGEGWNYVFGQAMLADRVGVWSMHRLGNPDAGDQEFVQLLRRTLHISAHETGHMFTLQHCIFYECCMNGSNHLDELDSQPLWLCPQCQAKVAHAVGADLIKQFTELSSFSQAHGLSEEAAFWRKSLAAIQAR